MRRRELWGFLDLDSGCSDRSPRGRPDRRLIAALKGHRIRWLADGLLQVASLSAGATTVLLAAGLAVPTALLAGSGISLIANGAMHNADRRESLRANPYAYVLSVKREVL